MTPAYNAQKYIKETIESSLAQTYQNWEMLIVDDCSSDETQSIIKEYAQKDSRIKYLKTLQNSGKPSVAKNVALKEAIGEYIAFLDSDDIWLPKKLEIQIRTMQEQSTDFCYCGGYVIDEAGAIKSEFVPKYDSGDVFAENLKQYEINNQGVIVAKKALGSLLFNEGITIGEDFNLFLNILANHKASVIKQKLFKYRKHSSSISAKKFEILYEGTQYTANELSQKYPDLAQKYKNEFEHAFAKAAFYKAKYLMSIVSPKDARLELLKHKYLDIRYFGLYLLSHFPKFWMRVFA